MSAMKPVPRREMRSRLHLALLIGIPLAVVIVVALCLSSSENDAQALVAVMSRPPAGGGESRARHDAFELQPAPLSQAVDERSQAGSPVADGILDDPYFAGVPAAWTDRFHVHGRVVDDHGAPWAGVTVVLVPDAITRQVVQEATGRTSELGRSTSTGTDGRFDLQTHRGLSGPGTRWWWDGQPSRPSVLVDDPRCAALLVECTDKDVTDCDVGTLRVPQGGLVSGRVVDATGKPVGGARVRLDIDVAADVTSRFGFSSWRELPETLRYAVTGADGMYGFHGAWPGHWEVILCADAWRATKVGIDSPTVVAGRQLPDLLAEDGFSLQVLVRDDQRHVVDDASVVAFPSRASYYSTTSIEDLMTRPRDDNWEDARWARGLGDGLYVIRGLSNAEHLVAASAAAGRTDACGGAWPGLETLELQLVPPPEQGEPAELDVFVENEARQPVPAARVRVSVSNGDGEPVPARMRGETEPPGTDVSRACTVRPSDPGRFTLDRHAGPRLILCVEAPGFGTRRVSAEVLAEQQEAFEHEGCPLGVAAAAPPHVHVVLERGARVEGEVVDERGAKMAGVTVRFRVNHSDDQTWQVREVGADETGHFAVDDLSSGDWFIWPFGDAVAEAGATVLTLAAGEIHEGMLIEVQRSGAVEGCARGSDGACPAGIRKWPIKLVPQESDDPDVSTRDLPGPSIGLDSACCFRVAGLKPGNYVLRGPPGSRSAVHVVAGEVSSVQLMVAAPPRLRVRVLDGAQPVPGARVLWKGAPSDVPQRGMSTDVNIDSGLPATDARGESRFELDEAGAILLRAVTPDGCVSEIGGVTLVRDTELTVELHLGTARLEGIVLDALSGRPIPGAKVGLVNAQAVTADAQGVFVLPRVGAGIVNLVASAAGYFQHECDTVFVSKDQILEGRTIELQPSATLVARVQGPGGVFVDAEVLVWCLDPAPEGSDRLVKLIPSIAGEASAVELPQGRYRLAVVSDPQTGDWELAETLDERHPTAQVATLAAGETREVFLHAGNGP